MGTPAQHLENVDIHNRLRDDSIVSIKDAQFRKMSLVVPQLDQLASDAARATKAEHEMGLFQGLKLYRRAVLWSMLLSLAVVMEGFDLILLSNLYAYGPFQRKFGVRQSDGSYQLTTAWQSGLSNGALVGQIFGLFINGIVAERFGYRRTIVGALMLTVVFIFIVFFAQSLVQLLIGEILLGVPWGVFQTITTTYAAEVCPVAIRAYLTTYVNLCWVLGQLIASGVLKAMVSTRDDDWGYRIPFALQWLWPIPIMIGVAFAPESPWWFIRHERPDEAKKALQRLATCDSSLDFNVDETVAMMSHTHALERAACVGTSYFDCFKRTDLRRTEIVCFTWAIQTLCGASLMNYSTYFYEQAGLAESNAFTLTMAQFALGACGTLTSWVLMRKFGRRSLYISGQAIMIVLLLVIGGLGLISRRNTTAQWAIGSMLLIYTFTYDATVGPVCYALISELSSNRLRAKTVVLARNLFNIMGIVSNVITPKMLNPSGWDWGAKSGFFWAGSCLLCLIWTFLRLPEPQGRTYGELDILFERGVSARDFKGAIVDPFLPSGLRAMAVSEISSDGKTPT